jgi:hypothetical protein
MVFSPPTVPVLRPPEMGLVTGIFVGFPAAPGEAFQPDRSLSFLFLCHSMKGEKWKRQ